MDAHNRLDEFFAGLTRRGVGTLLLDYDGTLAPFMSERMLAKPPASITAALVAILGQGKTHVAFVTGRPCRELLEVSGLGMPLEVWGCHGREHLDRGGRVSVVGVPPEAIIALGNASRAASVAIADQGDPGASVEVKTGCVAVHWRAASPDAQHRMELRLRTAWAPLIATGELLMLKEFDGGMELCSAGRSKGDAVRELWIRHGRLASTAFLGDDLTDEDGFEVLRGRGLCVLVRDEPRATLADVRITTPEGVVAFLSRWHHSLEGAPTWPGHY